MSPEEQRLRDLLVDAADDARPAGGAVVAARRRGQRIRHRRHAIAGAATMAVTGAVAVSVLILVGSHREPGSATNSGPTLGPGLPLQAGMRPVSRVEVLWQGQRNGGPSTVVAWFTAEDSLCLGEPAPGGYRNVTCGGSGLPSDNGRGAGFYGWPGGAAGVPNIDDGAHAWFLLRVGRGATHVTVTLTNGAVIPASLHLADGPQAEVLAIAIAPPHSTAQQFTAYDATGSPTTTAP